MKNVADIEDNDGAWVRIDLRPGTTLADPQVITVTIKDEALASVTLTAQQAYALIDGLEEAAWLCR